MRHTRTWAFVVAAICAAALTGCDKLGQSAEKAKKAVMGNGTTAESISGVDSFILKVNSCPNSIRSGLRKGGYTLQEEKADAILEITINHTGRNLDNIPSFGGVGNKANYNVRVIGVGDKVLYQNSGNEGSATMEELCGDIADEITASLRKRTG